MFVLFITLIKMINTLKKYQAPPKLMHNNEHIIK